MALQRFQACMKFVVQFVISLPMFLWRLICSGKAKVAIELIMFLGLSGILWFYGAKLTFINYISGIVLLVMIALHLIRSILRDVKTSTNGMYLPYVPALMIGAAIGLFLWF